MVINSFLKYKMKNVKSIDFNKDDIDKSKKILFSIFTRYGDTIIDLVVIKEFIEKYKDKKYLVLCPKQMIPYVNEILPGIKVIGVNKRNIFDMIKVISLLKKEKFDIGFNPWSNGIDSCYFISFCKKYFCYKDFDKPNSINHYEVIRKYFNLESREWQAINFKFNNSYRNILVCPESTDEERSISYKETLLITTKLRKKYPNAKITIAALDEKYFLDAFNSIKFSKSQNSSESFLSFLDSIDFVIAVDSGPLHIMNALKKDTLAIFNITNPIFVVNTNSKIKLINKNEIKNILC